MEFALISAWQSESDREVVNDTRAPHGRSWPGFTPSHTLCASAVHKGRPVPSERQECCVESWIAARGVDVAWDGYEVTSSCFAKGECPTVWTRGYGNVPCPLFAVNLNSNSNSAYDGAIGSA